MASIPIEPSHKVMTVDVVPPNVPSDKMTKDIFTDEESIIGFREMRNRVAIGVPYYENLLSRLNEKKDGISYEVKGMLQDYDFHFVALSCSFCESISILFAKVNNQSTQ
jgi:hypothetical protein